jgi:hypothetical protein
MVPRFEPIGPMMQSTSNAVADSCRRHDAATAAIDHRWAMAVRGGVGGAMVFEPVTGDVALPA